MGLSGKPQVDCGLESEGKRWVIAGIPLRAPLKRIYTNPSVAKGVDNGEEEVEEEEEEEGEECSSTPTSEEARIPVRLTCPPAPRKRRSSLKRNYHGVNEFFTAPDLGTIFIRHVERAN